MLVKGIVAVEILRLLVEMCKASIILSEQVWMCWNSIDRGRTDIDDEQRTGHEHRSTADEIAPRASAIMKEKCYMKLTDIDRQMHISVGAARSTDRSQLEHNNFSVQWKSSSHTVRCQ